MTMITPSYLGETIEYSSLHACRSTLEDPTRHDAIIVSLSTFEGRNLVDLRMHAMKEGRLVPTPKGLAMVVRRLPQLAKAINAALAKAQELGLLDSDEAKDSDEAASA